MTCPLFNRKGPNIRKETRFIKSKVFQSGRVIAKLGIILFAAGLLLWDQGGRTAGAAEPLQFKPRALENAQWSVPESEAALSYLGIDAKGSFKLSQIKAELVIIEFFSMYCPYCQADAPHVNELYSMIQKTPKFKKRVKIIGIGMGNTPFEVDVFRKKYTVPFPLVSDEQYTADKLATKRIRTPTFVLFRPANGSRQRVVDIHEGELGKPEEFLRGVTSHLGRSNKER